MNYLAFKKMETIVNNQLRLKTIIKNNRDIEYKKISCNLNFKKLDSFKNLKIIESLFFFRLISNKKSYISYIKKKYKSLDITINLNLKKKEIIFLLNLWIIFFFPLIKKKNLSLDNFNSIPNNFMFKNNLYNIFPFFPNIYFLWDNNIYNYLIFKNKKKEKINNLKNEYFNITFKDNIKEIV